MGDGKVLLPHSSCGKHLGNDSDERGDTHQK